jgi:hypothetical protein
VVLEVELVVFVLVVLVVLVLVADAVVVEDEPLPEKPNHSISFAPWMGTVWPTPVA